MEQEEWEETQPQQLRRPMERNPTSVVKGIKKMALRHWNPRRLPIPAVDGDLPRLGPIERSGEVIRFMLARLEYWLSSSGGLREFIKLNLRLAISIAIPVFMIAPLVSLGLKQFNTWISLLSQSMSSFVLLPFSVLLTILLVSALIYVGKSVLELRYRFQRREHYY